MWLIHTFVMSSTMANSSLSPYSDAYFCLMGAVLLADRMVARTEYPCLSRWSTTHISDEAISFSKEDLARCYDRHFRYQKHSRIWMGKPEALNEPVNEIGYLYIGSPLVLER